MECKLVSVLPSGEKRTFEINWRYLSAPFSGPFLGKDAVGHSSIRTLQFTRKAEQVPAPIRHVFYGKDGFACGKTRPLFRPLAQR